MAHEVSFDIPERSLGRADIKFTVKENGSWFPKKTTYGCKMGWSKFDNMMQEHATRQEKR